MDNFLRFSMRAFSHLDMMLTSVCAQIPAPAPAFIDQVLPSAARTQVDSVKVQVRLLANLTLKRRIAILQPSWDHLHHSDLIPHSCLGEP